MGRRVLAFFLGLILGIILVVGGVVGAVYIATCVVKVEKIVPESNNYIGDLSKLSLKGIYDEIVKLYGEKTMQDENGNYFTLEQFCINYNIDLNTALNGMELPQEVLDIPAFEFFREGGMERAMKQIKVSALPAIANLFAGKNEDGSSNGMFDDEVLAELANYSMFDLLSDESKGFAVVFANVKVAQLLPDSFPAEDSDNKLMWAVGQTKIGGLLNAVSGSDSILLQLKAGNAFEALGALELSSLLGESQYIDAILGSNAVFADLIADDGTIRLDDIINGVSVGELLGCQKNEITDREGYAAIDGQSPDAEISVWSKTVGEGESAKTLYIMSANGENWYEAELKCENTDEGHIHSADCFKYVWYSTAECTSTEHNHETNGDMNKDGIWYARTDGLYAVLAGLSITDLTGGSSDELVEELKVLKIRDVMGDTQVNGIMEAFVDFTIEELMNGAIDDLYLGEFFNLKREAIQDTSGYDLSEANVLRVGKERDDSVLAYYVAADADGNVALSLDKETWYVGKKECDNSDPDHVHHENCYSYVWRNKDTDELAEGVQNKLASKQIADMQYLNEEIQNMTLTDVFGKDAVPDMLKSIAEVKIGELSEQINTIKLGTLLEYDYELVCSDPTNHLNESDHAHDCYVWTDKNGAPVTGMMAKLAYKTVGDMGNLSDTIKTFTLHDVLGDDIPDMLKSLADVEIGGLNTAINDMYLGEFLEYKQVEKVCEDTSPDHVHDGKCQFDWYKLDCNIDHEHNDNCYTLVEGMMSKLAYNKVSELGNLNNTIQDFTLRDVLGDNVPAMLKDVADKPIGEVGDAIQDIYLGSALNYQRKEAFKEADRDPNVYKVIYGSLSESLKELPVVARTYPAQGSAEEIKYFKSDDGETWYEAEWTCTNKKAEHDHGSACVSFVWYNVDSEGNTTTAVSGIVKALVSTKVKDVDARIETMTLGEMGIGKGNNILEALQDTPINQIGDAINDLEMGVVLGYEKKYTCGQNHTHSEACLEWVAECTHSHEEPTDHVVGDHITIGTDGKTYYRAKGLNLKIADKTVSQMTGDTLSEIALSLTIGELIDSDMISLGEGAEKESNEYKLSLLFSNANKYTSINHSFTENEIEYRCNYTSYVLYTRTSTSSDKSTKTYWNKCHGITSDTELKDAVLEHRDEWKNLTLKEFVSTLLNVL